MPILIGRNGSSPTASRALLLLPQQKPLRNTSSSSHAERATAAIAVGNLIAFQDPVLLRKPQARLFARSTNLTAPLC